MVVEVRGVPARRQVGNDPVVSLRCRGPLANQTNAPQHPQMVGVDHQGLHSERAEIQGRRRRLATDTGQPFEPGQSVPDRPVSKEVEGKAATRRCDLLQGRFQPRRLHLGESHGMDHLVDLRRGRVSQPLPGSVPLLQGDHGAQ